MMDVIEKDISTNTMIGKQEEESSHFFPLNDEYNEYVGTYYSPFKIKRLLESIDELIANVKRQNSVRDSIGATLTWETKQVFSVDLMPGVGGEHVHSYIDAKYTEGEAVNRFRAIQRWFVSDGKIVQQSSYWQDIDDEEN